MLFAAFWSAVNRGLRPRKVMYFLAAKSTKNSPADAYAYFVPANVRNGRLFAGLQANRPRFLPLLAGTSFLGFGIGPESFAAERGGKDAFGTSRKHRSLRSPLEAVLNRRILAWSGTRTTAVFARGVLCTFWPQKVPIAVFDWCCLPLFGRLLTAVFARGG